MESKTCLSICHNLKLSLKEVYPSPKRFYMIKNKFEELHALIVALAKKYKEKYVCHLVHCAMI